MRRTRALLPAALLWAGACTVAGPRVQPRPEIPLRPLPAGVVAPETPDVRIGVEVDAPAVEVETDGRLEVTDDAGVVRDRGQGPWTVTRAGDGVRAEGGSTPVEVDGTLIFRPIRGEVRVNGTGYHGAVLIRPAASGVTAVNLLDLETYLRGVVPLEIGARPADELEAVKAQAVAARTYAVRHLGRRESLGFDYHGSMLDQVYGGADAEDSLATRAVAETRGVIVTYDGEPIEAFYHSTCGGSTAALEEVWKGEPRPYLKAVSDRKPGGGWYCEASNRFRWTEEWTESELLESLSVGLQERDGLGPVSEVYSVEGRGRSPSGRLEELVIETDRGLIRVQGDSIRRFLRPEPGEVLNSTLIEIQPLGGTRVTGLLVDGRGWGHGIGMCQMGARGRARAGQSYREILSTYYPGTRLVRLY